jgi:hypothetical protein
MESSSDQGQQVIDLFGEPGRSRTCDPLIKSQMLYQLSYGLPRGDHMGRYARQVNKTRQFPQYPGPQAPKTASRFPIAFSKVAPGSGNGG